MTLTSSWHILYIEGWSSTNVLSVTATYQGPDTGNVPIVIPANRNPLFVPVNFKECNPFGLMNGERNFTMCAYNVKFNFNVGNVFQFSTFYELVRTRINFFLSKAMLFILASRFSSSYVTLSGKDDLCWQSQFNDFED